MTKRQTQSLCIYLGERAQEIDNMLKKGIISEEHYMSERTAIDVIVSFISKEIGYKPYKYLRYSDVITANEIAKRQNEVTKRLETEIKRKEEVEAQAIKLAQSFVSGYKAANI